MPSMPSAARPSPLSRAREAPTKKKQRKVQEVSDGEFYQTNSQESEDSDDHGGVALDSELDSDAGSAAYDDEQSESQSQSQSQSRSPSQARSDSDLDSDSDSLDNDGPRKRRRTSESPAPLDLLDDDDDYEDVKQPAAQPVKLPISVPSRIKRNNAQPAKPAEPPKAAEPEPESSGGLTTRVDPNTTFESLGVAPWLVQSLANMAIRRPTPIQRESIPMLLKGRDCIGGSRTGSGKTVAFSVPILQKWAENPSAIFALILTPTRYVKLSCVFGCS